ncbi:MAG: S1 RNA-binding domain-containing protein [Anaerolineae bacterium]|nr:S1 RNA-binding domain-containing protein [Anaerolineae bacterium]
MNEYIPPFIPPGENYWQTLLEEGPMSSGSAPGHWEWVEASSVAAAVWDEARELQRKHVVMELTVDSYNRGGLIAHWKGVECFIPASHLLEYPFPADPTARETCFDRYLQKTLRLCVIEVEPGRNRILLSERQVAECELAQPEWPDWLSIGNICEGTVTSVRTFGAFVDIGPLEGMVHISEISWGRVRHPHDFLAPGQSVRVKILNIDLEHQRVGLSIKQLDSNPWASVEHHIKPGDMVYGKVASVERFGIFVELVNGLEGLLHISELEEAGTGDLRYQYQVGQKIPVRVLGVIPDEHRIALSLVDEGAVHAAA